ncbi:MAG: hypothetical protein KH452_01775 [Clostridiales bacterium]|nr:hypothetical protein [Clostridiales bacterium]
MKKMKIRKRIGALILSLMLLAGFLQNSVYAVEPETVPVIQEEISGPEEEQPPESAEEAEEEQPPESAEEAEEEQPSESAEEAEEEQPPENTEEVEEELPPETAEEAEEEQPPETAEEVEEEQPPETAEEAEEEQPQESTEEPEDFYHYSKDDPSTILTWKELYMPNGFEDLTGYDSAWWDQLYDYERELAEYALSMVVELSETVYDGQNLEECIGIIESGIEADAFFDGTVFLGLSLDALRELQSMGYTLEDVHGFLTAACRDDGSSPLYTAYRQAVEAETEAPAGLCRLAEIVSGIMPVNPLVYIGNGDLAADLSVSSTGYRGTSHGPIWKLTLGGEPALCLSKGKSARNGFIYNADPGTYEEREDGLGYLIGRSGLSGDYYVCVQVAAWLYQQSDSYTRDEVKERAYLMLDESDAVIQPLVDTIWNNYYGATQNPGSYRVFHSDNGNAQNVGPKGFPSTYTYNEGGEGGDGDDEYSTASVSGEASDRVNVEAEVTVTKHDSITGEVLEGAQIEINGKTHTSDKNGEVSHTEEEEYEAEASGPEYTYVEDWDSLTPEQQADADSRGYYHSRDEAYEASLGEANAQVQKELEDWAEDWSVEFDASETAPPYGYCNHGENIYTAVCENGDHRHHDFYNKPWEAWLKVTKHDLITGQTDFSLADAEFRVYEYQRETDNYREYRYGDRQVMTDQGNGTYQVGPLYYNPDNEGKFLILETESPFGYTIDQKLNRFYFEITGEGQITFTNGNQYNAEGTYSASQEKPHDFQAYNEPWKVRVDTIKVDENTGELLSGVQFDILRFNRDSNDYEIRTGYAPEKIPVKEQSDGTYLSQWIYWNYQNQGRFYLVESEARTGYFGDWKNRLLELITGHSAGWQDDDPEGKTGYYFQITGSRTEEGIVDGLNSQMTLRASANSLGTITNERTKGRVTVVKYDTESESQIVQGDSVLDGAVYELRAAEDIVHADGRTGVIYQEGDLVMTGTTGKTPVVDKYGYMLNTDGKRYITFGGDIQYKDTPGEFSFYNIELGSYILKEKTASEGYMLDETAYYLTFTYEDETQRVVLREESAAEDKNTLTIDDGDQGHEVIYTGDHVQKKAFSIIKTSDNQFQTELVPVEGAGFSVYLISELQGVRDGSLKPLVGNKWTDLDLKSFYDYDFTKEQTATVYKRKYETWTRNDLKWLAPIPDGQDNEYRVKEMFTDKKGAFTSPELPYGTYVVAETTVPEDHETARPFLVEVREDGGIVYTDTSRQTVLERHTEEKDIRFGDHANRSVYKDPLVLNRNAVEGREPLPVRYVSDNQTEAYLRLVKADSAFLPPDGTVLKPEELAAGTVLKEGAEYRIRIVDMTEREFETFTKAGWKKDAEDYIWYYETSSRKEYGTKECPFSPALLRSEGGKIIDCYLTLPAKLPTGTYEIMELKAPSGYVRNGEEKQLTDTSTEGLNTYEVTDTPADPVRFVLDNHEVYPDGQMGQNKYTLMDSYGNIVCTVFQDNQEQKGILELIKHGEKLYDASDSSGTMLKDKLDNSYFRRIWQDPVYDKKDYIFEYQDAPIEGAVFEVYAAEDIYTQELDKSRLEAYGVELDEYLVWEKGQKVAAITTDRTGYAYLADLYLGRYYIRESFAGNGFVLNPTRYEFEITAQDDHVNFDWESCLYGNQCQKVRIQVEKRDVENHEPLAGAVYGLYNKEDIQSFIEKDLHQEVPEYRHIQTVLDYKNADGGRVLIPAGTLIATAVTDKEGKAEFDEDLPLGEYEVRELAAPAGYTSTDQRETLDASWQGQETKVQEHTGILFENQRTKHVFTKSDIVSGVSIEGAYLELWEVQPDENGKPGQNPDGSYRLGKEPTDAWVSQTAGEEVHYFYEENGFYMELSSPDELPEGKDLIRKEGHLVEGLEAGRTYILRETLAPENYVGYEASSEETREANREENKVTEEVMFTVEDDNIVCEHDLKDQRTVGTFSVTKEGEFFAGTEKELHFLDKVKNLFVTVFQYVLGRVEQVSFAVYVKEDVFTPDQTGSYAEWVNQKGETLQLKGGTHIETVTTDRFGLATVANLPLGTYYVKETAVENGMFLINREEKEVTLSYVDQNTPIVFSDSTSYINERQKISVKIRKKEKGTDLPLQGAVFGLYAGENLYGFTVSEERVVNAYPEPFIKADTLLETVETDVQGEAVFRADVPNGKYYVKELQAPDGYLLSGERWEFDASCQGPDGDPVLYFTREIYNERSDVTVSKTDITNGKEIAGANLEVLEEATGQVVDQWISEAYSHAIGGIQVSREYEHVYILRETLPAPGYVTAEKIRFVVRGGEEERQLWIDQEGWRLQEDRHIVMKDDITKVEIQKTESDGRTPLAGAVLELLDEQGEVAATWTSAEVPWTVERLPIGIYTLHEAEAPAGYRLAEDMVLEVLDTAKVQKYVLGNERIPKKERSDSGEPDTPAGSVPELVSAALTGDTGIWGVWIFTALTALIGTCWFGRRKK